MTSQEFRQVMDGCQQSTREERSGTFTVSDPQVCGLEREELLGLLWGIRASVGLVRLLEQLRS